MGLPKEELLISPKTGILNNNSDLPVAKSPESPLSFSYVCETCENYWCTWPPQFGFVF